MMRTITLEIPEELADLLEALPSAQRNRYAVAALTAGMDSVTPAEADRDFEEACVGIEAGIADMRAGRLTDFDDWVAQRKAEREARKAAQPIQ
jgi:predicted transcriptional regulator